MGYNDMESRGSHTRDSGSPFDLAKQKLNVKDVIMICLFIGTVGITWGAYSTMANGQEKEIAALLGRVDRTEQSVNQLVNELGMIKRDTEWIRAYLNSKEYKK